MRTFPAIRFLMAAVNFDWELVSGSRVLAVMGRNERRMSGASLAWDEVAIVLGENAVVLSVNYDTDEVVVDLSAVPASDDWQEVSSLQRLVAKPLGWCWVVTNYRGYSDGFILALGDVLPEALEPKLMFLGEGSALTCFQMTPVGY